MVQKKQLSILEFSRLTGIRRENLRFYDRIGLLSPETRGGNNYRYYSRHQLGTAYLISSLRWLGVGIEEIKQYAARRTPENSLALFAKQDARMQAEIERLQETRLIMRMHAGMIQEALSHEENALFLEERPREPLYLCPTIPPQMDNDEGSIFSYELAEANGVNLGYPQGSLVALEDIEAGRAMVGIRYYFKVTKGANAEKPAGLYAVAYGRGDPWQMEPLYERLMRFVREQGLRACGDAYEEYPLGDLAVQEREQSCIRVELPVQQISEAGRAEKEGT